MKKLSVKKLVLAVIVFLAVLYGLFVAGITYKQNRAFRPYHNLAVELNNELGGGFSIHETKHCGLEGGVCPIVNMSKVANAQDRISATDQIVALEPKLRSLGIGKLEKGTCTEEAGEISYCYISGISKSGLHVEVTYKINSLRVDIYRQ